MHPPAHSFASRLEQLFAERPNPHTGRRYSDADVALAVGLSRTQVWNLRKGQAANPTWETINSLAHFFGVSPGYFFGDGDKTPTRHEPDDADLRAAMAALNVQHVAANTVGNDLAAMKATVLQVLQQIQRIEERLDADDGGTPPPT